MLLISLWDLLVEKHLRHGSPSNPRFACILVKKIKVKRGVKMH